MLENKAAPNLCVTMPGNVSPGRGCLAPPGLWVTGPRVGSSVVVSLAGSDCACSHSVLPGCLCTLRVGIFLPNTAVGMPGWPGWIQGCV